MSATIIILITLVVIVAVIVLYLVGAASDKGNVFKSVLIDQAKINAADMVYYLPAATLQINATATVAIVQDKTTQAITKADLLGLDLQNAVTLVPDTDYAFATSYISSSFTSDDIKLNVGNAGMLDSIDTSTDDKIGAILTAIANTPGGILQPDGQNLTQVTPKSFVPPSDTVVTTTNLTYLKVFNLAMNTLTTHTIDLPWKINVSGDVQGTKIVDATISLTFPEEIVKFFKKDDLKKYQMGVFSRPMQTIEMTADFKTLNQANEAAVKDLKYNIVIPNRNAVVLTPVKRSSFVKRQNRPKFSSGVLISNDINKPSQFEAICNIPVNIGKALASIPARLFTFTLQNKSAQQMASMKMQLQILQLQKQLNDAQSQLAQPK